MTLISRTQILGGVIPPITTPYKKNGDVDVASLEKLVKFELAAGVHAIFALGTGGEGPYQTEDQQHEITQLQQHNDINKCLDLWTCDIFQGLNIIE